MCTVVPMAGAWAVRPSHGLEFQAPTNYPVGAEPLATVVDDVNDDHAPDAVVASYATSSVYVLEGHRDGTFAPAIAFPAGAGASSVVTGHFNQDRHLDLAVADNAYGVNSVSILLGTGEDPNLFLPAARYTVGNQPRSVFTADFDEDGRLDLAVASDAFDSRTIEILAGAGDGTFGPPTSIDIGHVSWFVTGADLNSDGHVDLVVANGDFRAETILVLLGRGDGTFDEPQASLTGLVPFAIARGDFDKDRVPDLAVADCCSSGIAVLHGYGDGTFAPADHYFTGQNPSSLALADFNRDRSLDIATTNEFSHSVSILPGSGDGTFGEPVTFDIGPFNTEPFSIADGDFNRDHLPDLAVGNFGTGTISILLSTR